MHENQLDINIDLVRTIINKQFPEYGDLPLTPVNSTGTVNVIYRLGSELTVRMPRLSKWSKDIEKETTWLPRLSPHLSLEIPEPVAVGQATKIYPSIWAIYRWISGDVYSDQSVSDEKEAAKQLAAFVNEFHSIEVPSDAPKAGRRPLAELCEITERAVREADDLLDVERVLLAWRESAKASPWDGIPVWIHADLLRPNLLVEAGRLKAVIDFGSCGIGDPCFDLVPAWSVFGAEGRQVFQSTITADPDTWLRARAYALHQAALIVPYYRETNPGFVDLALRTIEQVLLDME